MSGGLYEEEDDDDDAAGGGATTASLQSYTVGTTTLYFHRKDFSGQGILAVRNEGGRRLMQHLTVAMHTYR